MNKERKITFDDVIGYDEAKKELREIEKYITDIDKYKKLGVRIPKGILLVGSSGNGKTMMVKALANEINIPIYSFGDEEEDDEEHIKNLRKVFKEARENSPSIIFIDELDKMNKTQFDFTFEDQESTIIRELVTQMDGYQENQGVIVIATANSTFKLDNSILRSGRFDRVITINNPNLKERELLYSHYCKNKKIAKDINYKALAKRTGSLSCADIDNVINDSALMAIREGRDTINSKDIEKAIDRVSFKSANKEILSLEEKEKIAVHEVGHAVVGICLGNFNEVNKISIESRGYALGHTRINKVDEESTHLYSKEELLNKIKVCLGGYAAEQLFLKTINSGCTNDLENVLMYLEQMIKNFGMFGLDYIYLSEYRRPTDACSHKIVSRFEKILFKTFNKCLKDTKHVLLKNKKLFNDLKNSLIENDVLLKEDIDDIVKKYA